MYRHTTKNTFRERRYGFIAILQCTTFKSTQRSTVFFIDNHVVADVNQTTGKVSGIGRFHSGIGQTLTCTVRRNEVFEHGHTFLKVRKDRILDNLRTFGTSFLRLSHQTTHTGKLLNLVFRTTSSGIEHHIYGVKALIGFGHFFHEDIT